MSHRLPLLALGTLLMIVVATATPAMATTMRPPLTPAQRIARVHSLLDRLEHRETILRSMGKTQRLAKVETRIALLQRRIAKLQARVKQ